MKAKKLSVRVGIGDWNEDEMNRRGGVAGEALDESNSKSLLRSAKPYLSYQFIKNEEAGYFGPTKTVILDEIGYMEKLPCPAQNDIRYRNSSLKKERSLVCQVDTEGATRVLIVSDDVIGVQATDETIVRRHLTSIKKEIGVLENIRKDICALIETMELLTRNSRDSLTARSTITQYNDVQIDHAAENTHCSQMNSDAIEYELRELVDFDEG
jgi:hypothetical protein